MDNFTISGISRRSDKRIENPQMEAMVKFDDQCYNAEVVNISRVGLRFRSAGKFNMGDKLLFELRCCNLNENVPVELKGKVKNEYQSGDPDTYDYGIKFCRAAQWHDMNMIHNFVYTCGRSKSAGYR